MDFETILAHGVFRKFDLQLGIELDRRRSNVHDRSSIGIPAIWRNCGLLLTRTATNDPSGCVIVVRVRIVRIQRGHDRAECKYEVGVSPSRKRVPPSCWQFRGASVFHSPGSAVRQQGIQNG